MRRQSRASSSPVRYSIRGIWPQVQQVVCEGAWVAFGPRNSTQTLLQTWATALQLRTMQTISTINTVEATISPQQKFNRWEWQITSKNRWFKSLQTPTTLFRMVVVVVEMASPKSADSTISAELRALALHSSSSSDSERTNRSASFYMLTE